MDALNFKKAGILTVVLVMAFITGYELYCGSNGFTTTYNDDESLWSTKRKEIYLPTNVATVFIGSSRIKFDLDIPTWESITGR